MGIPRYQGWLQQTFPSAFRSLREGLRYPFDHVYVDLNGLLHSAARRARNSDHFFTRVFKELDALFRVVEPRKSVFIAMDGPGPVAKLVEQRRRRLKAATKGSKQSLLAMQLTPGTPTMAQLKDNIGFWACSRLDVSRRFQHIPIRVSPAEEPGEGEIKCVGHMLDHIQTGEAASTHLLVGSDADLLLLGIASSAQRVSVLTNHVADTGTSPVLFQVDDLAHRLTSLFPTPRGMATIDFVILSLLMGNDYLPRLRGASLSGLWNRYLSLKRRGPLLTRSLVDPVRRHLNWPFFCELVKSCVRVPGDDDESHDEDTEDNAKDVDIQEYVRTLLWCLEMYVDGKCPDYRYACPSLRGPTSADILSYSVPDSLPPPARSPHMPLLPHAFCLAVMPLEGQQHVPTPLQPLMTAGELADVFQGQSARVPTSRIELAVSKVPIDQFGPEERNVTRFGYTVEYRRGSGHSSSLALPPPATPRMRPLRFPHLLSIHRWDPRVAIARPRPWPPSSIEENPINLTPFSVLPLDTEEPVMPVKNIRATREKNAREELNEICQVMRTFPVRSSIERIGPTRLPEFILTLELAHPDGRLLRGEGKGRSKRIAEEEAARNLLSLCGCESKKTL